MINYRGILSESALIIRLTGKVRDGEIFSGTKIQNFKGMLRRKVGGGGGRERRRDRGIIIPGTMCPGR